MKIVENAIIIKSDKKVIKLGYNQVLYLYMSKHKIELKYAGEPPHGDFFFEMYIDDKKFIGYVWGWTLTFPFKQKYIVCHWMSKILERKTIIIDIAKLKFVEMDKYWKVNEITDDSIVFTCREVYGDKHSKLLTLVTNEKDFQDWLRK